MHEFSAGSVLGSLGTGISSPGDSGGRQFRLWPDNSLDQGVKKGYSLEEIRILLGWRQLNLSSQYLEEPIGVLDVADTMDIGVLELRRALFGSQASQVRHKLLNEALEEAHRQDRPNRRELAHELAYLGQVVVHGQEVFIGGEGVGRDRKFAQHQWMA